MKLKSVRNISSSVVEVKTIIDPKIFEDVTDDIERKTGANFSESFKDSIDHVISRPVENTYLINLQTEEIHFVGSFQK